MSGEDDRFDVIVLGAGPGGEHAATRLGARGLRTALVERELVGGECAYWACIPSKTLLRAPEVRGEAQRAAGTAAPARKWRELASYRDYMIRGLDDSNEIESYERQGISVFKEEGRFAAPGQIEVGQRTLEARHVVIATGSVPIAPPIDGLADAGYWSNREATTLQEIPDSVAVIGGGPVGIELAQFLRGFGAEVHLIESAGRLMSREDPRVSELILEAVQEQGIEAHVDVQVASVRSSNGRRALELSDGTKLRAHELIVAAGRAPRLEGLALECVGIERRSSGIEIDDRCRAAEGVWAIGDVTGTMPFTHVAMYQARVACADILDAPVRADYSAVPRVVFCDPELAAVGFTLEQARDAGVDAASCSVKLREVIARPWTYETDPRGELTLVADRQRRVLVGAWAVAPLASEWIHYAALAIKAQVPIDVLRDTVAQFPTYTEAYFKALDRLSL